MSRDLPVASTPVRRRVILLAVAAAALAAVAVAAVTTGSDHGHRSTGTAARRSGPPILPSPSATRPTPTSGPTTTAPAQTPVQQFYDQSFERGFSSPANRAELARVASFHLPAPAIAAGWPRLTPQTSPAAWATEFVSGLLDIDFAHRRRAGLDAWLVAQHAPDLLPGIPANARDGELVAAVADPAVTGQPSPLPGPVTWQADAARRTRWSVSQMQAQVEPQWQAMVDAGWQPRDLLATVEDVSGDLTVTTGVHTTTRRFSVVVQLGSAAHHPGYGTVLVADWSLR